jgi:hypothetical protein
MDFNERFVTGPDNQWPWPLWGPVSVYFPAKRFVVCPSIRGPGTRECPREKLVAFLGKNTKAPIVSRGSDEQT